MMKHLLIVAIAAIKLLSCAVSPAYTENGSGGASTQHRHADAISESLSVVLPIGNSIFEVTLAVDDRACTLEVYRISEV